MSHNVVGEVGYKQGRLDELMDSLQAILLGRQIEINVAVILISLGDGGPENKETVLSELRSLSR